MVARARDTVAATGHQSVWWLGLYVLAIVAGLCALRFGWVWVSLQFTVYRSRWRQGDAEKTSPPRRVIAAMTTAGARGAITLAGALTLPLTMTDGREFPARDLAIFLASGVILSSLMIAAIGLPLLLRNLRLPADQGVEAERAGPAGPGQRRRSPNSSASSIAWPMGATMPTASSMSPAALMDQYRERLDALADDDDSKIAAKADERLEREMRLAAIRAERRAIFNLAHRREITTGVAEQLGRELDLVDARLTRFGTSG